MIRGAAGQGRLVFRITGFYFRCADRGSAANEMRNAVRASASPKPWIHGTRNRLELPSFAEGFDDLSIVRPAPGGTFIVAE